MDIKTLELDKILKKVSKSAVCTLTKERILNLEIKKNIEEIQQNIDNTEEVTKVIKEISNIPLGFFNDISDSIIRVKKEGVLNQIELNNINLIQSNAQTLNQFQSLLNEASFKVKNLSLIIEGIVFNKKIKEEISNAIDQRGHVLDDATPNLKAIRRKIRSNEVNIKARFNELLIKHKSKLSDSVVIKRDDKYVLLVKNDFKNVVKGTIWGESASGESVFIEPIEIIDITNKINVLKSEEEREIQIILENLTNIVFEHIEEIEYTFLNMLEIDFLSAKAMYAVKTECTKPLLNEDGEIKLIKSAHPLIPNDEIVKNDIIIDKYKGLVITGPNTGGKTVTLKTLGLLVLMNQVGLLIPVRENSKIAVFDRVYADIGDDQSIEQNLSTFSSHMMKIINILNNITTRSLVLFDEIGGGTDPDEGSNLAISIIEYLLKRNAVMIVTTHYPKLKAYALENELLENASVEFDIEELKPTYKLLIGVPGQSKALEISKVLGLCNEVIEYANNLPKKDDDYSLLLNKIESKSLLLDKKIEDIYEEEEKIKKLKEECEDRLYKLKEKEEKAKTLATTEAKNIIDKAKKDSLKILEEVKELKKKGMIKDHEISNAKSLINKTYVEEQEKTTTSNEELSIGDLVNVITFNQIGKIQKKNKNKFTVKMGNLVLNLTRDKLELVKDDKPKKAKVVLSNKKKFKRVPLEIDLRGQRYEEAKIELEKYLDDCLLSTNPHARIIHGYGTGAIDKMVQTVISKNKHITESRKGDYSEGGGGATIIYFNK